jgi:flagellar biosynthesis/type III secretory pathway chaperone
MNILEEEIGCYECLIKIARRKQRAIIEGAVGELRTLVREEQDLLQQAGIVAELRTSRVGDIGAIYGISERAPRLKAVIAAAPPEYAARLEGLRRQFKSCLDQMTVINRENRYLLNSSIDYVKNLVQLFLHSDDEFSALYDRQGMIASTEGVTKVFDHQI